MNAKTATLLVLLLGLATGCALTSTQAVPMPESSLGPDAADHCRIYAYRAEQTFGSRLHLRVYDNDQLIGRLGPGGYLCWERPAGRSLIEAIFERRRIDGGETEGLGDLRAEAGKVYWCLIRLNVSGANPIVEWLEEEEGRKMLGDRTPATVSSPTGA
jgi:hypothetical protein